MTRLQSAEREEKVRRRYEVGFMSQKTAFFIVTAVKTSNLTVNMAIFLFNLTLYRL
jgi:hypothetical protein